MKIGEGEKGVEVRGGKGGGEQKQKRKHSVDNLLFVYVCMFVCLLLVFTCFCILLCYFTYFSLF